MMRRDRVSPVVIASARGAWRSIRIIFVIFSGFLCFVALPLHADTDAFSSDFSEAMPAAEQTWQIHYATASALQKEIQSGKPSLLSSEGLVYADDRTNRLWVSDDKNHLAMINNFITEFDVPAPQVLIKVRILSVDDQFARSLGLDFVTTTETSSTSGNMVMDLPMQTDPANTVSLPIAKLGNDQLLNLRLMALEQNGHAKMISDPELMASNRQSAEIESGEEIPYQEQTGTGNTTTDFKKAALKVLVTPMVMPHQQLLLNIAVNQDRVSELTVKGVPAIETQHVNTTVLVPNKGTIVLGGIYEDDEGTQSTGIPGFSAIPVLGNLFTQKTKKSERKELMIFVTPEVMQTH